MIARLPRALLWPTVLTAFGLVVLIGLGTWQLQRMAWKSGLIRQIEARTKAPPISLAEALQRSKAGEDLEYARVALSGRFLADRERFFWAPSSTGSGWHVYVPLETADGQLVLVNRGLIADEDRDRARRPEPVGGTQEVVGLLRKPATRGLFTPENDAARNAWYWRDLAGLAASMLGPEKSRALPFFIDAERGPLAQQPSRVPRGGTTHLDIPNNHFQYALTWYGLALTLLGVYSAFAWPHLRQRSRSATDSA